MTAPQELGTTPDPKRELKRVMSILAQHGMLDTAQRFHREMLRHRPPAGPTSEPVAPPDAEALLPHAYLLAKLAMVMPLFQEARDALPAITELHRKTFGVSPTLADRMDFAGTYSLDDWLAAQPMSPLARAAVAAVPLPAPEPALELLREFWAAHQNLQAEISHGDATAETERKAVARYDAAIDRVRAMLDGSPLPSLVQPTHSDIGPMWAECGGPELSSELWGVLHRFARRLLAAAPLEGTTPCK